MKRTLAVVISLHLGASAVEVQQHGERVMIGSRLELLVDKVLIESLSGGARLLLHHPVPREVVFRTDAPWEGNASAYQSVFFYNGRYRMYYRGGHYKHGGKAAQAREPHPWVLCYAESDDGIHWRRPELGIREWAGSKKNNIVLDTAMMAAFKGCPAHTAVFVDHNPACPPDAKIKIIAMGGKPHGLYVLGSPDGLHFRVLSDKPIQTEGAFDSQNLVFWDSVRGEYRMYHRGFNGAVRDVLTATSQDILHFPKPEWIHYPGSPTMALYTNQIQPYYRAPHLFMGFPMRYCDRGWSGPMLDLPGQADRVARAGFSRRYGTTVTDAVFMTSRDGRTFRRWSEAFIRPGPKPDDSWVYGDMFVFWGMVETESIFGPEAPKELSFYVTEGYWQGADTSFRRYTLRVDGFVSANAPYAGGEVLTKPLTFAGGSLALNLETSAFGSVQVEIQEEDGTPIEGFRLEDCPPIFCDRLAHVVRWQKNGGDVRALAGRPVRLRFLLRDADLYAFQFVPYTGEPERPDLAGTGYIPPKNPDRKPFVVIDDDFRNVPAGTSPTDKDLNPFVGDGDSGWVIREGAPDRVQVLNDDPVGSGKPGSRPYLKVERRDENSGEGGRAWIKLAARDVGDATDGVLEVEARILVPSTVRYCADIDAYDNQPPDYGRRAFHLRFFPDGTVKYWNGKEHVAIEGLSFQPDAWTDVKIRADLKKSVFALTMNGRTARDLPFVRPDIHRVQCIYFGPNTKRCVLYVQRVRVRVEP